MKKANILIIGAGAAGKELHNDIKQSSKSWHVEGFLDDFVKNKHVLGVIDDLTTLLSKRDIHKVFFAIPRMKTEKLIAIRRVCYLHGVDFLIVPPTLDTITQRAKVSMLRELSVEDVLGKNMKKDDFDMYKKYFAKKRVVVTGAAGSIGSELMSQLSKLGVGKLIAVDNNEYG